jgi:hypothetical protein
MYRTHVVPSEGGCTLASDSVRLNSCLFDDQTIARSLSSRILTKRIAAAGRSKRNGVAYRGWAPELVSYDSFVTASSKMAELPRPCVGNLPERTAKTCFGKKRPHEAWIEWGQRRRGVVDIVIIP